MKLFILTPHYRNIEPEHQASILLSYPALKSIEHLSFEILQTETSLLPLTRSDLCELALTYGADKVLFIDSDIEFSAIDIGMLLDANKPIVGGLYVSRYYPLKNHVYVKATEETLNQSLAIVTPFTDAEKTKRYQMLGYGVHEIINPPEELFKCDAIGTGFMMIDADVLRKMFEQDVVTSLGRPFNLWQTPFGNQLGEDLSFCHRARTLGFEIWCEPRVDLSHIGPHKFRKLDYQMSMGRYYCNDIPGWMSIEELNWLYNTAKGMDSIIEIGSWKGRSTHALLSGCKGTVTAIDHFKGSANEKEGPHKEAEEGNIKEEFLNNVGKFTNLRLFDCMSHNAIGIIEPADMIFIDASHTYEDVKRDIELYKPYAKKILCGHDFKWAGVNRAVDETLGLIGRELHDSIWVWRK